MLNLKKSMILGKGQFCIGADAYIYIYIFINIHIFILTVILCCRISGDDDFKKIGLSSLETAVDEVDELANNIEIVKSLEELYVLEV